MSAACCRRASRSCAEGGRPPAFTCTTAVVVQACMRAALHCCRIHGKAPQPLAAGGTAWQQDITQPQLQATPSSCCKTESPKQLLAAGCNAPSHRTCLSLPSLLQAALRSCGMSGRPLASSWSACRRRRSVWRLSRPAWPSGRPLSGISPSHPPGRQMTNSRSAHLSCLPAHT